MECRWFVLRDRLKLNSKVKMNPAKNSKQNDAPSELNSRNPYMVRIKPVAFIRTFELDSNGANKKRGVGTRDHSVPNSIERELAYHIHWRGTLPYLT